MVIIFGSYETALGVCRSLGEKNINLCVVDFRKSIAQHSKYVKHFFTCPNPSEEDTFLTWVRDSFLLIKTEKGPIPVFITSDDFISIFNKYRKELSEYFLFNIPSNEILDQITNKFELSLLASEIGIPIPYTLVLKKKSDINSLPIFKTSSTIDYPVFVKGLDVNLWRKHIVGLDDNFYELASLLIII